jgi:hypothetical protein
METEGRNSVSIAVSNSLPLPKPGRLTDFPSMGRNELRKDAGGCWEVPAGARISENSGVTRRAHPSAGTGRHGHGDWMETDRSSDEFRDLLIRARRKALAGCQRPVIPQPCALRSPCRPCPPCGRLEEEACPPLRTGDLGARVRASGMSVDDDQAAKSSGDSPRLPMVFAISAVSRTPRA